MLKIYSVSFLIYFMIYLNCFGQKNIGASSSGYLTSLPPETPTLLSPTDSAYKQPEEVNLFWKSQVHTSFYHLQLSKEINFNSLVIDQNNITDTIFTAKGLDSETTFFWRVLASNVAGKSNFSVARSFTTTSSTAVELKISSVPKDCILLPPYPNPFKTFIIIKYYIPERILVNVEIYNGLGQIVRNLISEKKQSGKHEIIWDGKDNKGIFLTNGHYICVLSTNKTKISKSILLNN